MKIITISREFGSGGRELGRRLADILDYDYYDGEIITAVAKKIGMNEAYLEKMLENHGWQSFSISYHSTFHSTQYFPNDMVSLLLAQKRVIEGIAALGKNFVIVGRNADLILKAYYPLNLFVCAEMDARIRRCMERAKPEEQLTEKECLRKIKQIDKARAQTRAIYSEWEWGRRDAYHLTVNTTGWNLKELAPPVAEFAECYFARRL
ncbi:MAG: cytidylate kinase-like family protein [Christensenellales bacterium]|nr:cytidylate kinase-like family protein [Christensenellales bacterium]